MTTISCPKCNDGELIFDVYTDANYGADADGNRGMSATFAEFDTATCDCNFSDDEIEKLADEAATQYEFGGYDEPDWDDFEDGVYAYQI